MPLTQSIRRRSKHPLHSVYLAGFLFTIHYSLLAYVSSSYLNQFVSLSLVSWIFAGAAILAILTLSKFSTLLSRFGNFKVTAVLLILIVLTLGVLYKAPGIWAVTIAFLVHQALVMILVVNFDIYIDELSSKATTGVIRGIFLTVTNLAWVFSPLFVGWLVAGDQYWRVYLISIIAILATLAVTALRLRGIPDVPYQRGSFWQNARGVWRRPDIFKIFMANFLLLFFYAWMVVYLPIYLHQSVGFDWLAIGKIFSIMLIPFVIFELPLGILADRRLGEKELLLAGFLIIATSTVFIPFINSKSIWLWAAVLLATRVGASFVEIMSQTYFYKKVGPEDANTIEFFDDGRPLSFLVAPIVASVFLAFFDLKYLFLALAILVASGLYFAATIKDTR